MRFASRHPGKGKTEITGPTPRRDGLGAALRSALGVCETLPDDFSTQLADIDAATRQPRRKRD